MENIQAGCCGKKRKKGKEKDGASEQIYCPYVKMIDGS